MRETLADFLADMGDPKRLDSFNTDPAGNMAGAGLSPAEKSAVSSGDSYQVGQAMDDAGLAVGDVSNGIAPLKAPGKKAPARKAPKRKAPARKAPKRKAPAKKAPKRKAPARKAARKTSKKTSRKVARKTARKAVRKTSRKSASKKR